MKSLINKKEHMICLLSVAVLLIITGVFLLKDQELSDIFSLLASTDLKFIFLGLLAMVLFFAFEARAIQILLQPLAGKRKFPVYYRYALIDFYFSSITPGCSGGQPSQLYFMHRDNIPVSSSSLALLAYNTCCHIAVLLIAAVTLSISGLAVLDKIGAFKYLLIFGVLAQSFLIIFYLIAIFNKRLAAFIVHTIVKVLAKIRIIKNKEAALAKVDTQIEDYRRGAAYIKQNPLLLLRTLLISCLNLLALYSVPFWIFNAFGLGGFTFCDLIAAQVALTLCVESLPIPGGMGVTESGFLLIYASIFGSKLVVPALLLTRGLNYYTGLLVGGIASAYSMRKRKTPLPVKASLVSCAGGGSNAADI